MSELRYWNLIQIKYSQIKNGKYSTRMSNIYRLLPVYDLKDFDKSIQEIENKYSKEQVKRAIQHSSIVYAAHDLYEIENIIQLELAHGQEAVKEVFNLVASYGSKSDSRKSMRYVVGFLNKEKKGFT
ncbi:MAG: hypothetical protein GY817_05005 [bacterium]|nr:hypothetical protein [bacterium]